MSLPDPAAVLATPRPAAIPVTVLTGFLGSGKTTLLRRALQDAALADTAVLVNEWGEIGLDHHLVATADDRTVLLANGCLCCSLRSDLVETLFDLLARSDRDEIPAFRRVMIETTGLADPVPILQSFMTDPLRLSRFKLAQLVTTVDGLLGASTLARHTLSVRQVALADRLLVTKADLAAPEPLAQLKARLRALNPGARIEWASQGHSATPWWQDSRQGGAALAAWLEGFAPSDHHNHKDGLEAICLESDQPLSWPHFQAAAKALVQDAEILRMKGLVWAAGEPRPILVNGVQHIFHDLSFLDAWPEGRPCSQLVLIGRGLDRRALAERLFGLIPKVVDNGPFDGTPRPSG